MPKLSLKLKYALMYKLLQKLQPLYLDNYVSASYLLKCNGTKLILCKFHKEKRLSLHEIL